MREKGRGGGKKKETKCYVRDLISAYHITADTGETLARPCQLYVLLLTPLFRSHPVAGEG